MISNFDIKGCHIVSIIINELTNTNKEEAKKLYGGNTIFALVSCNDVDTSSTTSVVTTSSSAQNTSESIATTSSITDGEQFVEDSSSSTVEESSSEQPIDTSSQVTYHVRFVNYDDTLLYETDVVEGESVIYDGQTPKRNADDNYTYSFKGWDKELTNITSNMTIKATYDSQLIQWGPINWDI